MSTVDDKQLTEKELALIDKRRITSARNAEKARLKRMEKQQQIKELEKIEYEKKREDFNNKMNEVVKPVKKVKEVYEDSDSDEEFIIYNTGNKKKMIDQANEELKKELESMKNEIQTLKKPKEPEPVITPAPIAPQSTTKIVYVKPPNANKTEHLKQTILKF
jgi:hypothetical protein